VWVLHGVPQAINAGDLLFYVAMQALERAPLPAEESLAILRHHTQSMRRIAHGQAHETALRRDGILPTPADWRLIARGKTGALFAHGLVAGATIAGLRDQALSVLGEVGLRLGELFQLQDDLLDLVGEKGRAVASDLWEGKPSWLIARCSQELGSEARARLAEALFRPRSEKTRAEFDYVRELLVEHRVADHGLDQLELAGGELMGVIQAEIRPLFAPLAALIHRIRAPLEHLLPTPP
jgi:geranylgeranyl pyrophosphate synthase